MKRLVLLLTAAALAAGCASAPAGAPSERQPPPTAPVAAAQPAATEPVAQTTPTRPDQPAPADNPAAPTTPSPAKEPAPAPPSTTVQIPTNRLQGMTRVAAPTIDSLPAPWREALLQTSPWSVADGALAALYGASVVEGPYIAPALQAKALSPLAAGQPRPVRTWRRHVDSWEQDGRFYFHLQVTAEATDGRLTHAGDDVVEMSRVEGSGYVVTGYGHTAVAPTQARGPVSVWSAGLPASYSAPVEVALPAPAIQTAAGQYLVPLAVAEQFGKVQPAGANAYKVLLPTGELSAPITTTASGGTAYVAVEELVRVFNGARTSQNTEAYTYQVDWKPTIHQLILRTDHSYPIS